MTKILRYPKPIRSAMIITAAVELANESGLVLVSPATVSKKCMVPTSEQTVRQYYTKAELYAAVLADERCSEEVKKQASDMGLT